MGRKELELHRGELVGGRGETYERGGGGQILGTPRAEQMWVLN